MNEAKKGISAKTKIAIAAVAAVLLVVATALCLIFSCGGTAERVTVESARELSKALSSYDDKIITVDEDITVSELLTVNGNKTITGSGTISVTRQCDGATHDEKSSALVGCPDLSVEGLESSPASININAGGSLTLDGSITVDLGGKCNGIRAKGNSKLVISDKATVQNACCFAVLLDAQAQGKVSGGNVLNSRKFGIVSFGSLDISGGKLDVTEVGALVYSSGTLNITGGDITGSGVHNIYTEGGTLSITGGNISGAAKDGVVIGKGTKASITGGNIENCSVHGVCNSGETELGKITLYECGIANNANGQLTLNNTTVDTSSVYCLSNLGGTVYGKGFTALRCDTTAVCNFAGDMTLDDLTVSNSRGGNLSNESGNLTVNGATLGICRDKSVTVGSGVARLTDVKIEGTSTEKYGVYTYSTGALYLTNVSIDYVNQAALKADGSSYVEMSNVTINDSMGTAIWAYGGTIVGDNITVTNAGGHGIANNNGEITISNIKMDGITSNGVMQRGGNTNLTKATFTNIEGQGGSVESGNITIIEGKFDYIRGNGIYITAGSDGVVTLNSVTFDHITKYGINNGNKVSAYYTTIKNTGEAGIINKKMLDLVNVTISDTKKDGIYNNQYALVIARNLTIHDPGTSSTPIYNRGEFTAYGLEVYSANANGVYNQSTAKFRGSDVVIHDVGRYGIYNYGGSVNAIHGLTIYNTGDHNINNSTGNFVADNITLSKCGVSTTSSNFIYNTGTMTLDTLKASDGVSHGIFNKGTITGSAFDISNTKGVGYYNNANGVSNITGIKVDNVTSHGICNIADMTVSGMDISNVGSGQNAVYNNDGAKMHITGSNYIHDCKNHGLTNTASTITGDGDLTISNVGQNAVYIASGNVSFGNIVVNGAAIGYNSKGTSTVSSLVIKNVTNTALHNTGTIDVTGNVTVDTVNATVTGDNQGNGIYSTGTVTIGGNCSVSNVTSTGSTSNAVGNSVFSRGKLTVGGNLTCDTATSRALLVTAGTSTINGTVKLLGTYGKESMVYAYSNNSPVITMGAINKTVATDKYVIVAGDKATVTVNGGTIANNSTQSAVVAQGKSTSVQAVITLNNVSISNIGGNAIDVNGGKVVLNGVSVTAAKYGINSRNQAYSAVVVKGTNTIKNTTGNAVYVQKGSSLTMEDNAVLNISWDSASANHGVILNASGSKLNMGAGSALTVSNATKGINLTSGAVITADPSSTITLNSISDAYAFYIPSAQTLGNVVITNPTADGMYLLAGDTTATSVTVSGVPASKNGILGSGGNLTVSGNVAVSGNGGPAIQATKGIIKIEGTLTASGCNNAVYGMGGSFDLNNVSISGASTAINLRNAGSSATIRGNCSITDTTSVAVYVQNGNTLTLGDGSNTNISWSNAGSKNAIEFRNTGSTLNVGSGASLAITNAGYAIKPATSSVVNADASSIVTVTGAQQPISFGSYGKLVVNSPAGHGISLSGTSLEAASIIVSNVGGAYNAINLENNSSKLEVTGDVVISGVTGTATGDNQGNGIRNNVGTVTIGGNLSVSNISNTLTTSNSCANAVFNRGTLTVNGNVSIYGGVTRYAMLGTANKITVKGNVTVAGDFGADTVLYVYSSGSMELNSIVNQTTRTEESELYVASGSGTITIENGITA